MPVESHDIPKVMRIHLLLSQYPGLAGIVRHRMRLEIFRRGIIAAERLEQEAREKAILSQRREGILNPLVEETPENWDRRLSQIRDYLTDFYFAYNLPQQNFDRILEDALLERAPNQEIVLTYNPELAPWDVLFRQAEEYETMPEQDFARVEHHLREIKVVLIKGMISDDLAFVRIAKEYLTMADLKWIRDRRIGQDKIGGKAAGMVLASRILQRVAGSPIGGGASEGASGGTRSPAVKFAIPESFFVCSDIFYEFLALNNLSYYVNQKYKPVEHIESEYPQLQQAYLRGRMPEHVVARLRQVLAEVNGQPLIVRSSSLLEDNFNTSFAGKYESVFCANQGSPEQNLAELIQAIVRVYASVSNPDALLYRRQTGLVDYDERMAVLIQAVQGTRYGDLFFPAAAGVAYSRNPFLWNSRLRREDGFVRLVVGLGTRAVERVGEDYPRMVALSHPQLRPESGPQQIRYYSQYYMDLINLRMNCLETRRIEEVLRGDYPGLRYLASVDRDEVIRPMFMRDRSLDPRTLVMTFDGLLGDTDFVPQLKAVLKALELAYGVPIDIEFTVGLDENQPRGGVELHLLQCRPQSGYETAEEVRVPDNIPDEDVVFGTEKMVPTGRVPDVRYVVYVDPARYAALDTLGGRMQVARLIGRLNQRLDGQRFILMGPGRWGSSSADLGLKVTYADIYNTRALIEMGMPQGKARPTLSYGTHFFQDLVESHIYPLAIFPGEPGNPFRKSFFDTALNALPVLLPDDKGYADTVKVLDVPAITGGRVLELVMSGEQSRAVAYLRAPSATSRK